MRFISTLNPTGYWLGVRDGQPVADWTDGYAAMDAQLSGRVDEVFFVHTEETS